MPAEPRTAAACILVRGDAQVEVLLARRNPALKFMGGHHVFPGGRMHEGESASRVAHAPDADLANAIQAAAREVFEETGLLCVRGPLPPGDLVRQARRRLLNEELNFTDFLERHALAIDADDFEPAGDWLTPPFVPIRFQTRYFLHRVRNDQQEELIEGEIVGLDWLTPAEARSRWHRGQIWISTPVAYTLRQLAAAELPTALPRLRRGTQRAPGEHNWFEVRRGITLVPVESATLPPATHTNCVIVGEETLYVIDPGARDEAELDHLVRQIDHLIELGGRVEAVLLTHSHVDHTAAADELRQRYDAPIMAHPAAADQLPLAVDRHLGDGDILVSGSDPEWRLRCIHTPGHDPGHLCFLEESTGALVAGDMVANPGTIVVSRAYAGDMADFMHSLERLLKLDCKLIIPAHGQPAGSPREFLKRHLDHRLWREAKIQQAHDAGAATFDELLARAYDDAPPEALVWARHALDAHLAKLGIEMPAEL
jgi:glyoxylase-like metal-dependent hydrolase (beta-lactamase superfamily II)/8-oxo-dGTP pyrophosphatase MutT (NUDIX family)